jgi:hypothetical protein
LDVSEKHERLVYRLYEKSKKSSLMNKSAEEMSLPFPAGMRLFQELFAAHDDPQQRLTFEKVSI